MPIQRLDLPFYCHRNVAVPVLSGRWCADFGKGLEARLGCAHSLVAESRTCPSFIIDGSTHVDWSL